MAGRLEEMQAFQESKQLDAMFKMAGMGGDAEEDDDDEPSRKKREPDQLQLDASSSHLTNHQASTPALRRKPRKLWTRSKIVVRPKTKELSDE